MKYELDEEDGKLKVESELKFGENKNKFEFELEAEDRLKFKFNFKNETENSEASVEMEYELRQIVEFEDNSTSGVNTNGGYDDGETVYNTIDFQDLFWSLKAASENQGGNTLYNVNATTSFGSAKLVVSFYFSSGYITKDGVQFNPNSVKWDLIISNYTFSSNSSALAFEVDIQHESESNEEVDLTEDEKEQLTKHDESGIVYNNNSINAFFTWANTYTVDGTDRQVVISDMADSDDGIDSSSKIYFNFEQGQEIYWDPKVGVTRESTSPYYSTSDPANSSSSVGFEFLPFVSLIGLVSIVFTRRRLS